MWVRVRVRAKENVGGIEHPTARREKKRKARTNSIRTASEVSSSSAAAAAAAAAALTPPPLSALTLSHSPPANGFQLELIVTNTNQGIQT